MESLKTELARLTNQQVTKMPFGKHRGKLLTELPTRYISWVLANLKNLWPELRDALFAEYRQRPAGKRK